jgi:putative PIN family toxin of toxin-antitoxin system
MNNLRFVIDTNILISAILINSSTPDYAYKKAKKQRKILFSELTFEELRKIIIRHKFDKYILPKTRHEFINKLRKESEFIDIVEEIKECRDEKDNKFLELAVSGNADFIITGDNDLLVLNPFRNIKIITPKSFLEII